MEHSSEPAPAAPRDDRAEARPSRSEPRGNEPGDSEIRPPLGVFAEAIRRIASSDVTLLIEGETGSGKNLAARAAHAGSARSGAAYVEIQLAALTPTLLESELFGHEAGAFTGAHQARAGRLLRAQHGTLVLDGVECLPPELQVKLLRVLQERTVEPLGAEQATPLDVRVIALSGRDLEAEVRAGRFREDLYYRLAVVKLRVPPLRARLADLPELSAYFLAQTARRLGVEQRALAPAAVERLAAHAWPGNLRELENALERVSILAPRAGQSSVGRSGTSTQRAGPIEGAPHRGAPPIEAAELDFLSEASAGIADDLARQVLAHGIGLEQIERVLLLQALNEQRGNLSAAARRLGLSRRAFEQRYERSNPAPRAEDKGPRAEDKAPREP